MERSRRLRALTLVTTLLVATGSMGAAEASSENVTITNSAFTPDVVAGLPVEGVVSWSYAGGGLSHSVHQLKGLFDSGDPTSQEFTFDRTFSAGVFDYRCEVHSFMTGKVKVKPMVLVGEGLPIVTWAGETTNTGGKFDVQFKVGSGDWKNWKKNRAGFEAVFGADDKPVQLKAGKTYRFRARSQKGSNDTKVSGWSPARKYVHG